MTITEVSERTRVPVQTLYAYRSRGGGPRAIKLGRRVLYAPDDVEAWVNQHASEDGRVRESA